MEGLRGFAVFLVFLVHYVSLIEPWITANPDFSLFTTSLHTMGSAGVDLFFVLSGYLIYGSLLKRRQQFIRFMSRRIQRIYPAFLAVFTVYIVLSFVFPAENKIPSQTIPALIYLLQNLFLLPGLFPIEPMMTVAWSLSYEMFYYVAIPGVIAALGLRERRAAVRTTCFLGMALLTAIYCAVFGGHIRLIMFISGIVLYEAMNNRRVPSPSGSIGLIALILGLFSMLIPIEGSVRLCAQNIHSVRHFFYTMSVLLPPACSVARPRVFMDTAALVGKHELLLLFAARLDA